MAKGDDEDQDEGNAELKKLQKAIKTNRTMLFSLLVCAAVIISILITSVFVINLQLSNRREIPSEEFADLLLELDTHLKHISAIHNSEAKVYFEFQDSLDEIKALYQHEKINELRELMIAREKDNRKLLDLMAEGTQSLARMSPGSRDWSTAYEKKTSAEKLKSQQREKNLMESMKEDEPEEDAKDDSTDKKK